MAKKESKVTPVLLFLGAMLLSFLVSLCFLVADREPNAASWCPFAFFLGVPLLSTLGVTFLSFGVSRFYLGVAFASFLPPRCLLSWCHVGFFLGVTLLSFLGSHFFFLLPFCFQLLVLVSESSVTGRRGSHFGSTNWVLQRDLRLLIHDRKKCKSK